MQDRDRNLAADSTIEQPITSNLIPKLEHLCQRCTLAVDYCRIAGIDRHEEAEPALRQRLVRYRSPEPQPR